MEANRLLYEALLHVMKNLPQQCDIFPNGNTIDYKYMFRPVVLMEDQCSGDRSRVTVDKLTLVGDTMYYNGHFTDFDDHDSVEDVVVDCYDGETCKEMLDAITEEMMLKIKPFNPLPQTVVLCGSDEAKIYDEYWNSDNIEGLKELAQNSEYGIHRRNYLTQGERNAYYEGVYDAEGWLDVRCFENDKRIFDIE